MVRVMRVRVRMVSVDGRWVVMVGGGGGGGRGGRVVGRRTAAVGRRRHGRPQVAGRTADGQRRRRVVRRSGHAAVHVPLVASAARHGVVAGHDRQRQPVLVAARHTKVHRHRAERSDENLV